MVYMSVKVEFSKNKGTMVESLFCHYYYMQKNNNNSPASIRQEESVYVCVCANVLLCCKFKLYHQGFHSEGADPGISPTQSKSCDQTLISMKYRRVLAS